MKKYVKKAHAKKNHNYKNVKENKNMKNSRKMTEVENMLFVLRMQAAVGDTEHMKNVVHEDLFYTLRTLMEVEGIDMSFMDKPDVYSFIESICKHNKEKVEAGSAVLDQNTRQLAKRTFKNYLSGASEEFTLFCNASDWEHRMHLFVSFYVFLLSEHYADREGWIKWLAATAEEFLSEINENGYECVMDYISLFVLDYPTIELSRSMNSIVQAFIEKQSA